MIRRKHRKQNNFLPFTGWKIKTKYVPEFSIKSEGHWTGGV